MNSSRYCNEVERALARFGVERMRRQLLAYAQYGVKVSGGWPGDLADDFSEIITCHYDDPEKALAYAIIAASQSDDASFLGKMACCNLENVLRKPIPELLERIVTEAQKSARSRWLLNRPFKVAVADRVWEAIAPARIAAPCENRCTIRFRQDDVIATRKFNRSRYWGGCCLTAYPPDSGHAASR